MPSPGSRQGQSPPDPDYNAELSWAHPARLAASRLAFLAPRLSFEDRTCSNRAASTSRGSGTNAPQARGGLVRAQPAVHAGRRGEAVPKEQQSGRGADWAAQVMSRAQFGAALAAKAPCNGQIAANEAHTAPVSDAQRDKAAQVGSQGFNRSPPLCRRLTSQPRSIQAMRF